MEFETITKVAVARLRLDRLNPRLIGEDDRASDEAIVARLYRAADLDELLQSITANGYMDIEPLVVMDDPEARNGELIVLEGNRRLAALRLLREPDLARSIAASEGLRIAIPPIADPLRATLDEVSVYPVANRERARSFIGFKHINGPAKWDAYAKARFAAEWYKEERSEGVDLAVIARAIGDKHDTIKRMVSAIYVLDQAKNEGLFDIEDRHTRKFNFSHLYTALSRSQYMEYLGLGAAWARHDPEPNQVRRERLEELRKVLVWIYGSREDGVQPVVQSQNPDIKRLGEVLAHAQGRHPRQRAISTRPTPAPSPWTDSSLLHSYVRGTTFGVPPARSEPMTDGTSRCSTSQRTSRNRRRPYTHACSRSDVKRAMWNDGLSVFSPRRSNGRID